MRATSDTVTVEPTAPPLTADAIAPIERLAGLYTFRDPDEVDRYLGRHPVLVPLLLDAAAVIPRYFDGDRPIILEVFLDPESDDEDGELFASIQVAPDPDEAVDRLVYFIDDWWLARSPSAPDTLVFDIGFGR